jgi:hypothetical protein
MSHHEHTHHEEKKSVNFWGPVIGGIVVWLIILIIETNLDEPKDLHSDISAVHSEQVESQHH